MNKKNVNKKLSKALICLFFCKNALNVTSRGERGDFHVGEVYQLWFRSVKSQQPVGRFPMLSRGRGQLTE